MVYYELACIAAHYPQYHHIQSLVKMSMKTIFERGGVVRQLKSSGTRVLPQRMRSHKTWHEVGDYWTMRFDASPRTMSAVTAALAQDPRVVRWTVIKLGEKLEDILKPPSTTLATP